MLHWRIASANWEGTTCWFIRTNSCPSCLQVSGFSNKLIESRVQKCFVHFVSLSTKYLNHQPAAVPGATKWLSNCCLESLFAEEQSDSEVSWKRFASSFCQPWQIDCEIKPVWLFQQLTLREQSKNRVLAVTKDIKLIQSILVQNKKKALLYIGNLHLLAQSSQS